MKRRLLSFLLAAVMTVSAVPVQAFAAEAAEEAPGETVCETTAAAEESTAEETIPASEETTVPTEVPTTATEPSTEATVPVTEEVPETIPETVEVPEETFTVTEEPALASSGTCGADLTWTLSGGTLTISGSGAMQNYSTTGQPWSSDADSITTLVIQEGVTSIGKYAFYNLTALTSVTIPGSVLTIGAWAFQGCKSLTAVYISDLTAWCSISFSSGFSNPLYYAKNLYLNGSPVRNLVIPSGLTTIPKDSFTNCESLTSVSFPAGMTKIAARAFDGCTNLRSISIPSSVKTIESGAFADCKSLTSVTIPEGVTVLDDSAFINCSSLSSISLPNSLTTIGRDTFFACALSSVTIPASVTSIDPLAFSYMSTLKKIQVSSSNTTYASDSTGALFNKAMTKLLIVPNGLSGTYAIPSTVTTVGDSAFLYCSSLTGVSIPSSVTSIEDSAFSFCLKLTSITIPKGITKLSDSLLWGCSELTRVTLPEGLLTIEDHAFHSTGITGITLPDTLTTIGEQAFYDCRYLGNIVFPKSVTSIGNYAFAWCDNLSSITFLGDPPTIGEKTFSYVVATALYPKDSTNWNSSNKLSYGGTLTWVGKCVNHVEVIDIAGTPATCTTGGVAPKSHCSLCGATVQSQETLPALGHAVVTTASKAPTCTEDGISAGSYCERCQDVFSGQEVIPALGHTVVEDPAVAETCTENGLTAGSHCSVCLEVLVAQEVIPAAHKFTDGICTVCGRVEGTCEGTYGDNLRWDLDNTGTLVISGIGPMEDRGYFDDAPWEDYIDQITTIVVKDGVTSIGDYAFKELEFVTSVTLPEGITAIGEQAFASCEALTELTIPASVTAIEKYAFRFCYSLERINLPEGLKTIESNLFYYCDSLTSLTIPESVTAIGESAFEHCESLTSMVIPRNVASIGKRAFQYCEALPKIQVDPANKVFYSDNSGVLYNRVTSTLVQAPGKLAGSYFVQPGILTIGEYAFYGCDSLTALYLPDSVVTLETYAIGSCSKLTSVQLPSGIANLPKRVLYYCSSLKEIVIPASVVNIDSGAFYYCRNMTRVTFLGDAPTIAEDAFYRVTATVHYSGDTWTEANMLQYKGTLTWEPVCSTHTAVSVAGTPATCTKSGLSDGEACSVCGAPITAQEVIPALGHKYSSVTVEATCSEDGSITRTCETCGDTSVEVIPATGIHAYETVTIEATCDADGSITRTCETCGDTSVQVIPATGIHAYETVTIEATCVADGSVTHTCTCGDSTTEVLKALGHSYADGVCVRCGEAAPTSGQEDNGLSWQFTPENGQLTISGCASTDPSVDAPWSGYTNQITSITISGDITQIDPTIFDSLKNLETIRVSEDNPAYTDVDGILFSKDLTALIRYPSGRDSTSYTIPEAVTFLSDDCFLGCNHLDTLYFPGSAPDFSGNALRGLTAEAHYPAGDPSWTQDKLCNYGGDITWIPVYASGLEIFQGSETVTGQTIWFDLKAMDSVTFSAAVLPKAAYGAVRWSYDTTLAAVTENADGTVTLIPTGEGGTMTLSATALGTPDLTESVTIKFVALRAETDSTEEVPGEEIPADIRLLSGKSRTLKVYDDITGKALTAKQIKWSLAPEYAPYATLTAKGKLTAKKVVAKVRVEAVGTIIGSKGTTVKVLVDIYPTVTHVEIFDETGALVNGQTLKMSTESENPGIDLSALVYPADAMEGVTWKSSSTKTATVDENGVVRPVLNKGVYKSGTVTITATASDGSKKKATVKIQIGTPVKSVTITEPSSTVLRSGKTMTLKATTDPAKPSVSGVTWTITDGGKYATISSSGKLTAKTVYEQQTVTVIAISKDAAKVKSEPITITILPKAEETLLLKAGTVNVTGQTVSLDSLTTGASVDLTAYLTSVLNGESAQTGKRTVTWKSSSEAVASLSAEEGETVTVTLLKAGKATITASVTTDSGKTVTAKVTVSGTKLAQTITITEKGGNEDLIVASGKSMTLQALVQRTDSEAPSSKAVTWSVDPDYAAYAKISSSGKLTATANLTREVKNIPVTATAKDGSVTKATVFVTVKPLAQGVQAYSIDPTTGVMLLDVDSSDNTSFLGIVRSNTTLEWDMEVCKTLQLSSHVYPYYNVTDARNADQKVTWKSSSPKVASVDASGLVTFHKAGSATITATAADGSNQKVSFKLQVVKKMTDLTLKETAQLDSDSCLTVTGGKTLNLSKLIQISPSDTTNKKLTWTITDGKAYASLTSTGSLKAKKVLTEKIVTIRAEAQDGSEKALTIRVKITPAR